MDGNRRWAKKRGLPSFEGHRVGVNKAIDIAISASDLGIKFITFYIFSTENWDRSVDEVKYLMGLFEYYFKNKSKELVEKNIKVQFIGDFTKVPATLKKYIKIFENKTNNNTGMHLYMALGYGGRAEIIHAAKKLAISYKEGNCLLEEVNEDFFKNLLYAKDAPYPDLLIRSGGDLRVSNFLLWQIAYTEFYFTKTFWPDFSLDEFKEALAQFDSRERRHGQ